MYMYVYMYIYIILNNYHTAGFDPPKLINYHKNKSFDFLMNWLSDNALKMIAGANKLLHI